VGGAVGAEEPRLEVLVDVGNWGFLIEIAIALPAFEEALIEAQPLQLRRRPRREDPEGEEPARLPGHRPFVEDRQVSEVLAAGVAQGHAEVALDTPLDQGPVVGELPLDAAGVVAQVALDHVLAGRAREVPLDVVGEVVADPVSQRAGLAGAGELGDEGVAGADRPGQVENERPEELLPRRPRRPLDDGAQGGHLVLAGKGDRRPIAGVEGVHPDTSLEQDLSLPARRDGPT